MASTVTIDLRQVARGLDIPLRQVQAAVELLDEGNTVPFITRYRKDQTGGLDEEQIRADSRPADEDAAAGRPQADDPPLDRVAGQADREAGQADSRGRARPSGWKTSICRSSPRSRRWPRWPARAGWSRWPARSSKAAPTVRRSRRPGGRLRQHRSPGAHGGRRPAGRRPHPGRAVQRAGRAAAAAPRDPAADRRVRQRRVAGDQGEGGGRRREGRKAEGEGRREKASDG